MKVRLSLLIATLSLNLVSWGQLLNQDADGKSSFVVPGGMLGFDVAKTEVSFNYNQSNSICLKTAETHNMLLWGIGIKGKTENNLAEIINGGNFLPSGELNGLFGFSRRAKFNLRNSDTETKIRIEKLEKENDGYDVIVNSCNAEIKRIKKKATEDGGLTDEMQRDLKKVEKNTDLFIKNLSQYIKDSKDENQKSLLKKYRADIEKIEEDARQKTNETLKNFLELDSIKKVAFSRWSIYLKGDFKATGFDYFIDSTGTFYNNFDTKAVYDWNLFLGFNQNINRFAFGVAVGIGGTNNLSDLKTRDYSISTSIKDSITKETLTTSKKFSAYTLDSIYNYNRFTFQLDLMQYIPLDKGKAGTLALNFLYARMFVPFTMTNKVPATLNLGISANFINQKGKFTGGIYLQYNDLWGARSTSTHPTFFEKISFGIITRFNFARIFTR